MSSELMSKKKKGNMQEKCKCKLCGDRNETINQIISESRKLT